MNLDHITTLEDFKQRIPALISCGDDDSFLELEEIYKRFDHGRKLKKSKSDGRSDNLKKVLVNAIERLERYNQPLTYENILNSLGYCFYDDDGQLIIERIEYESERMEVCI